MEDNEDALVKAVRTCIEKDACYWYRGACGLSSGKREVNCPNLDRETVLKKEFYSSPSRTVEECFRCGYKK